MYFGVQPSVDHCISTIPDSKPCQTAYTRCERGAACYILEISHILLTLRGTRERELGGRDQ